MDLIDFSLFIKVDRYILKNPPLIDKILKVISDGTFCQIFVDFSGYMNFNELAREQLLNYSTKTCVYLFYSF